MLVILSRHVVCFAPYFFNYLDFQTLNMNIPDVGYSRNASICQMINTFRICSYSTEIRRRNKEKDLK